jgi:hypothetical protein
MAVSNMFLHATDADQALPIFRKALAHSDESLRTEATHGLLRHGSEMLAGEAHRFEELSGAMPQDLALRVLLLGHYFLRQYHFENDHRHRQQHILWIIKNAPATPVAGDPHAFLNPKQDGEGYELAKQFWLEQARVAGDDSAILRNAAAFFTVFDKELCEQILKDGQALEPRNPHWSRELGLLYALQMNKSDRVARQQLAIDSLLQMESAFDLMEEELDRNALLANLAKVALDAGEGEKARKYAMQLLTLGSSTDYWDAAGALHQGNLALGRLALRAGDVEQAKTYLLSAARLPDGKRFGAFGPNMRLAKELLEIGERDVVQEYLRMCSDLWDTKDHCAEHWIQEVQQGKVPAFGGNLNY